MTQRRSHIVQHQEKQGRAILILTVKKATYISVGEQGSVLLPLLSDLMIPGQIVLTQVKNLLFPNILKI